MSNALDAAFVIGVLATLTKGADLLLLESQKKAVDRGFRRFYDAIRNLNPADWIRFLRSDTAEIVLFSCVALVLLALGILNYWPLIETIWHKGSIEKGAIYLAVVSIVWGVKATNFVLDDLFCIDVWFDLPKWLLESPSSHGFVLRYCILIIYLLLPIACFALLIFVAYKLDFNFVLVFVSAAFVLILTTLGTPLLSYLMSLSLVLFPIFLLSISLVFLAGILAFLRGLCDRILEYSKGVYAALVLLITVMLGFVELWNKT